MEDEVEVSIGPTLIQKTDTEEAYDIVAEPPHVYSRVLYGARFPKPASEDVIKLVKTKRGGRQQAGLTRSAAVVTFQNERLLQLRDPYPSPLSKTRFEDAYRVDPIVRRAINLIAKFTLGRRTNVVVDLVDQSFDPRTSVIPSKDPRTTLTDDEIKKLKDGIDRVNKRVKFHEKIKAAVIQAKVFGRAALLIEGEDEDGLPMDLKVLSSRKLSTVYANPDTWALEAVEYQDREKDQPLKPNEIIYLTNQDFHVSPDTLYYGLSEVEPIVHVSEANRLIDEEDLKEGNRGSWAHHGLIKFPPNVTEDEIDEFLDNFYPGTWNGTSQDVMVETHNLNIAVTELVHERNENDKRILRGLGVPAFLIGFEDVTNRATTVAVLHAWRESELSDYRTWLQDLLEPQWFDSLARLILPDKDWGKIEIKARLEFEDITFESLKEKADAVIPLFQSGLISAHKALKMLDMDDELEHMMLDDAAEKEMREQELIIRQRAIDRNPKLAMGAQQGAFSQANNNSFTQRGKQTSKASPHDAGTSVNNIATAAASIQDDEPEEKTTKNKKEKNKDQRRKK